MEFVTYEMAMKLKEKGFAAPCIYAYCKSGGWNKYRRVHEPIAYIFRTDSNPFGTYYIGKNWNKEYETNKNKIQCSAPTISQVLKWLREEKECDLVIEPQFHFGRRKGYGVRVFCPSSNKPVRCGYFDGGKKQPLQALSIVWII